MMLLDKLVDTIKPHYSIHSEEYVEVDFNRKVKLASQGKGVFHE